MREGQDNGARPTACYFGLPDFHPPIPVLYLLPGLAMGVYHDPNLD